MKKITVHRARPGDVLAESVMHGEGQILLGAGTRLDSNQLTMLRQRGVAILTIEDGEPGPEAESAPPPPPDPEALKAILVEESIWFGEARKGDFMAEVFRYVVNRRAREGS